jgi:hypothetical protein
MEITEALQTGLRNPPGLLSDIGDTGRPTRLPAGCEEHTMTGVVWANLLLAVPFLIAFIGVPLWMTFRRPQSAADH